MLSIVLCKSIASPIALLAVAIKGHTIACTSLKDNTDPDKSVPCTDRDLGMGPYEMILFVLRQLLGGILVAESGLLVNNS